MKSGYNKSNSKDITEYENQQRATRPYSFNFNESLNYESLHRDNLTGNKNPIICLNRKDLLLNTYVNALLEKRYYNKLFVYDKVYSNKTAMESEIQPIFFGRYALIQYTSEFLEEENKWKIRNGIIPEEDMSELEKEYYNNFYKDYYESHFNRNYDGTIWRMNGEGKYEFFACIRQDKILGESADTILDAGTAESIYKEEQ